MSDNTVGEVNAVTYTYRWVINDFSGHCINVGHFIKSPEFSTNDGTACKWRIYLYPKGDDDTCKDNLSIYLFNRKAEKVTANATFGIVNQKNALIKTVNFIEHEFSTGSNTTANWGFPSFAKLDFIMDGTNGILTDDTLIIQCKIIIDASKNKITTKREEEIKQMEIALQRLPTYDELEHLINDTDFSDVTLVVEGQTIEAHKCILARRSPVFAAMFKAEMKEKLESKVEIEDIKYNIVMEMLRYMYAGKVNDIQTIASDLLAAADKYALDGLKIVCGKSLFEHLNNDSAVESLKIADQYRMDDLKVNIIKFIVSHSDDIVDKPEFESLPADVLCKVCRAINKNKK